MKYTFTILLLMIIYPGLAQANPRFEGGPRQQRMQRMRQKAQFNNRPVREAKIADRMKRAQEVKEAYVKAKLNLSPDQNEKFLPLFRQYQAEMLEAQNQRRLARLNPEGNGLDQIQKEDELELKVRTVRRHYTQEFLKIMPPEKVVQIYKNEEEFKDEALKQLKEKRDQVNN